LLCIPEVPDGYDLVNFELFIEISITSYKSHIINEISEWFGILNSRCCGL
jgi:hypothetical protein